MIDGFRENLAERLWSVIDGAGYVLFIYFAVWFATAAWCISYNRHKSDSRAKESEADDE